MATATPTKPRKLITATAAPAEEAITGDDGYPVRMWNVNGEDVAFSLRPYTEAERKTYWNPQGNGAPMWWRSQEINDSGFQPIIQREVWIDGKFSPRNDWEEHMTREWLLTIPGGNPDKWVGYNHPDNEPGQPPHQWRCSCGWLCGNWQAFKQHQQQQRHSGFKDE